MILAATARIDVFRFVASALIAFAIAISTCNAGTAGTAEIAFTTEFAGDLYVMDARTLSVQRISVGLTSIGDLAYSHRNRTLALVGSQRGGGPQSIFLLTWPGAKLRRIPYPSGAAPYRPQFDPEGRYIYAVNYGPEIFRYSLQGGHWARLPVDGVKDIHVQMLALSPSGHLAVISPADFKGFLIAEVAPDHFRVTRTVLSDFDSCTSAQWIDENHIVFLGRKTPGYQFVWLLDLETGQLRQLTQPPIGTRDFLSLSRDGTTLVFTATDTNFEWTLWRLNLNSQGPIRLLPPKPDDSYLFPTWID